MCWGGGEGKGGPESWFDQAAGARPHKMLGKAAVVPEEGEEMGSVWSGFSMEEVLPSGWMWQREAGHQSPWNQG